MFSNTKQNFSVQVLISLFICMLFLSACDKKVAETVPKVDAPEKNEKPVETTPSSTSTVSNTKFDQMLDDYEAIIVEYETIAKKDVICNEDWMNLMSEVNPKLMAMGNDMQASQKEAQQASPLWLKRYMELTMRYSKMAQELSKKKPGSC